IDIYPTIIKSYFNTLIGKSASTIRINKQIITAMFESAYIDEITNRNPCKNIKTPEGKKGSHRNLDITEIRTIIKLTNYHRLGPFVTFCLFTGMRRGEALAFNVNNNINFDNNTINIDKAIRFNSNQLILTSTKTKAGVRTIPLFKPAKEAIANKDGLLLDKNGSYPTLSTFERAWESYMKLFEEEINGITKREYNKKLKSGVNAFKKWENHSFRHHDLRHTFCTMLFNSNVDIKTAQKWMGHSDPETTLKIYTHLSEEKEKQSELAVNANILNDYINQQF
ncbi:MAG: site-specific integrase, partial [Christensenellaceae bacterium]|nr:site-specific integrase [Christensenellaceae bacterium]